MIRALPIFVLLLLLKGVARLLYRFELRWLGDPGGQDPWRDLHVCAILHHTSLYEVLFAGICPTRFLWRIARRGVVPVADKTLQRPLVGTFFRLVARNVVSVTRKRDHTWHQVVESVDQDSLIIILPEGRMMRADGLDSNGQPMTVRGGIADLLDALGSGNLLMAYSGGLHHVQVPGEGLPKLFRTIHLNLERLDIAAYLEEMRGRAAAGEGGASLRKVIIRDMEHRRDTLCPTEARRRDRRESAPEEGSAPS